MIVRDTLQAGQVWLPKVAWVAATTGGAATGQIETAGELNDFPVWDFDQTNSERVECVIPQPAGYGALYFKAFWTASAGAGGVYWQLSVRTIEHDAVLDDPDAVVSGVSQTLTATGDLNITSEAAGCKFTGAAGSLLHLSFSRQPGQAADTLNADARLIGVLLSFK